MINEVAKTSDKSLKDLKKILKDVCFKYMYKRDLQKIPLHVIKGLIKTMNIVGEPFMHESVLLPRVNNWID